MERHVVEERDDVVTDDVDPAALVDLSTVLALFIPLVPARTTSAFL